jgi:hypothetical protein
MNGFFGWGWSPFYAPTAETRKTTGNAAPAAQNRSGIAVFNIH